MIYTIDKDNPEMSFAEQAGLCRERIARLRERLAEQAAKHDIDALIAVDRLAGLVNSIAEQEGSLEVLERARYAAAGAAEQGDPNPLLRARRAVIQLITDGARDTWSGRSNDTRRAQMDGRLEAARPILSGLIYGRGE